MLQITSRLSLPNVGSVSFDREGNEHVVVVVKATYRILDDGSVTIHSEQVPILFADAFSFQPGTSSVRYEADLAPRKPGIDFLVNGTAYAKQPVRQLDVEIRTRRFRKAILVSGDRIWRRGVPSQARPFTQMPITYERAFGGVDSRRPDRVAAELRNPVGVGFFVNEPPDDGTPVPNIEDPTQRISGWKDRVRPTGFGVVGRSWRPRVDRAGTYDAIWMRERFPLLPGDFDEAHFLAAPDDQVVHELSDEEPVLLRNFAPEGDLRLEIPRPQTPVYARWSNRSERLNAFPDTVVIEPDRRRLILVSRRAIPIGRKPDRLREVIVGDLGPAEERAVATGKRHVSLRDAGARKSV